MKAKIVVGLAFGDEGKGITTDFWATKHPEAIVVRFSGGQQAAHTVMTHNSKHVFSSFGSGTLRGLPTYFSAHCTVHPGFLYTELKTLEALDVHPVFFLHPLAKLTTPFDVWHNRKSIKNLEHGTCGKGVGATMKRNEGPYKLYAIDLLAPKPLFMAKLQAIASYYGIEKSEALQEDIDYYLEAVDAVKWQLKDYLFLKTFETLLFEGSQGILLDMDHGIFPSVTYANTTSKNAISICKLLDIEDIETYYVTRTYQTRHGAGWMSNENAPELLNTEEETCIYNPWQKALRIGAVDYDLLNYALQIDAIYNSADKKHLVVTCLDQLDKAFEINRLKVAFDSIIGSFSPNSADMRVLQPELLMKNHLP